jgi:hypothetical protein
MRLSRPRHGTVVAYVALFAALGGTSYAAAQLPRNSVGTSQIRNSAVTGAKIASGTITSSDVRNGSLTASDFRSGSLPQGPAGPAGPAGAQGPAGAPGSGAAIAFGNVNANGQVDPNTSQTMSTANITHNVQGVYCIGGLPQNPRNVQVTAQNSFNGPVLGMATLGVSNGCPNGTQASIALTQLVTGAAVNNAFFVSID